MRFQVLKLINFKEKKTSSILTPKGIDEILVQMSYNAVKEFKIKMFCSKGKYFENSCTFVMKPTALVKL